MLGILISLLLIVCNSFANNTDWAQQDLHFMHDAIRDNHPDIHIESDQQLRVKIKAAIAAEFDSYNEQSSLFSKALERGCNFYNITDHNSAQACTFAVQALRNAHNTTQIDAFYYICCIAVLLLQQSPEQAVTLIANYADAKDNEIDEKEYLEIKNMVTQKVYSSPEQQQCCLMRAMQLIKAGCTFKQVDNFITLLASSNSLDVDGIDSCILFLFCFCKLIQ